MSTSNDVSDSPGEQHDEDIAALVADLRDRVSQLEDSVAEQRARLDGLAAELSGERDDREAAIRDEQIQRTQIVQNAKDDLREDIEALRSDLVDEQKTRSRADALVEKRVTHLADELDVAVDDAVAAEDKLVRLLRRGPDDVVDRVYPVHERARELLVHATVWGSLVADENGRRLVFVAPEVKPYLAARFDRTFSTSEVERVFTKLVDLGADSPRRVRKDKSRDGYHRLLVWRPDPLLSASERMRA
ncbi:hypothetical protein [Halomicrococcus gelatinilyticus]|uniref:hypothetical protein n=1 Tax=Halomicrococcus gelatinilyticus TaxID=1702103 RepID=UPI002E0DF68F